MKKLILAVLAIFMILTFAGCAMGMPTNTAPKQEAPETAEGIEVSSYDDNIAGLKKYFVDKGYVIGDDKKMSSDLIGAKEGYRYQFTYQKSNVSVEMYEYDLENLNDTAKEVIKSVNEQGTIKVQGTTADAVMADNGKYLMIYKKDKDNDENNKREEEVVTEFKEFYR